jgi:HK97 gp10 family phage protein
LSATFKASGFEEIDRKFAALAAALAEERVIGGMMLDAIRPTVEAARAIVGTGSPQWQEAKLTRPDIDAEIDKEREIGSSIAVSVGARRRAFVLRFLEFGTSQNPAFPVLRPAWDSTRGAVAAAVVAGLRKVYLAAMT